MASALKLCSFLLFLIFSFYPLSLKSEKPKQRVPALYVFGDSLVDCGNNIVLANGKAIPPYGIDFYRSKPTGRATNGKTVADYFALHLGLPLAPAYLTLSKSKRSRITTGINYASGGSGILRDSNNCDKSPCLPLDKQIGFYRKFVQEYLVNMFKNQEDFDKYQSRGLFFVTSGVNDLANNLTMVLPSDVFDEFLLDQLAIRLKRLYSLGARKFLVNNIPPKGCFPASLIGNHEKCPKSPNVKSYYNRELPGMLKNLQSQLPGSTFSHSDFFKFFLELRGKARKQGISDVLHPCCPDKNYTGNEKCLPNSTYCDNRNNHLFFDQFHPSQIANHFYAKKCFNESSICTPLNLRQLGEV